MAIGHDGQVVGKTFVARIRRPGARWVRPGSVEPTVDEFNPTSLRHAYLSCNRSGPVTDWGGPAEPQRRLPAHKGYYTPIRRERSRARFYIIAKCRQTQDCLISLINSLMARFNSLLGRNKFPVLLRRELGRKPLNYMLDCEATGVLRGPDEQNCLYFPS
jgi:hypothetical protein